MLFEIQRTPRREEKWETCFTSQPFGRGLHIRHIPVPIRHPTSSEAASAISAIETGEDLSGAFKYRVATKTGDYRIVFENDEGPEGEVVTDFLEADEGRKLIHRIVQNIGCGIDGIKRYCHSEETPIFFLRHGCVCRFDKPYRLRLECRMTGLLLATFNSAFDVIPHVIDLQGDTK